MNVFCSLQVKNLYRGITCDMTFMDQILIEYLKANYLGYHI